MNPLVSFHETPRFAERSSSGIVMSVTTSADEAEVCEFLKLWPGQFVSAREVCRRAGGKWRYREDERWALPVLQSLLDKNLVEADAGGHYRLITQEEKNKMPRLIWSGTQNRFLQSGDDFGVIDLDKDLDPDDCTMSGGLPVPHSEQQPRASC